MVKENRGKLLGRNQIYPSITQPTKKLELTVLKGQQLQFTYNIDNNYSYLISLPILQHGQEPH